MKKKTLVLGASNNPSRYSYMAVKKLDEKGHPVVPIGIKKGNILGHEIQPYEHVYQDVDTITLYLGPSNQIEYYDYILSQKPKRVIFNPGTYNEDLISKLKENDIETIDACTLVMLSAGTY